MSVVPHYMLYRMYRSKTHPSYSTLLWLASQLLISAATPSQPSSNTVRRCHVIPHFYLIMSTNQICKWEGVHWINLAAVRDKWRILLLYCKSSYPGTQSAGQLTIEFTSGCQHSEWHSNVPLYDGDRITTLRRVTHSLLVSNRPCPKLQAVLGM